jgi:hypothetical protein
MPNNRDTVGSGVFYAVLAKGLHNEDNSRAAVVTVKQYLVMSPKWGSTPRLTDLTDRQSQRDFDFDFELQSVVRESAKRRLGGWCEMAASLGVSFNE